jgi:hypothetical protein
MNSIMKSLKYLRPALAGVPPTARTHAMTTGLQGPRKMASREHF